MIIIMVVHKYELHWISLQNAMMPQKSTRGCALFFTILIVILTQQLTLIVTPWFEFKLNPSRDEKRKDLVGESDKYPLLSAKERKI
jgi:hypothetical protein